MGSPFFALLPLVVALLPSRPAPRSNVHGLQAAVTTLAPRRHGKPGVGEDTPASSHLALAALLDAAMSTGAASKDAVQREAAAAVVRSFTSSGSGSAAGDADPDPDGTGGASSRATVVMPSGSGKTVLALRVAEALRSRLTVVLVPARDLVSQSFRDWERWCATPGALDDWRPLGVCSSTSVPRALLPRTTASGEIAKYLRRERGSPCVIFSTYRSAGRVGEALEAAGMAADLLVCDESHRCTGLLGKLYTRPLEDAFLPSARRLFVTATPKLLSSRRDSEGALVPAGSMEDVALFGRVVFRLGYAEAVRRGLVSPLKLVMMDVSEAYARQFGAAGRTEDRTLLELCAALADCRTSYGVRIAFAFSASNRRAEALEVAAKRTLAERGFAVGRVDGGMLSPARERQLEPLRGGGGGGDADPTWLVTNCRVLSEGVDLPAVDLVVFADAKSSHVDILQCMGRASRLAPGKQYGHVLVPVGEEGGGGSFGAAVEVMRAEQDEEFSEGLAALVSGEAKTGRPLEPEEWPAALRRVLLLDAASLRPLVAGRLVATVARELVDRWERMYGLLEAYVEREDDAFVPYGHVEGGEALGAWVMTQRTRYASRGLSDAERKGRSAMSDEQVRRLAALGMVWRVR